MASQPMVSASRSVSGRNTPSISSAMAPTTSTISGAISRIARDQLAHGVPLLLAATSARLLRAGPSAGCRGTYVRRDDTAVVLLVMRYRPLMAEAARMAVS